MREREKESEREGEKERELTLTKQYIIIIFGFVRFERFFTHYKRWEL